MIVNNTVSFPKLSQQGWRVFAVFQEINRTVQPATQVISAGLWLDQLADKNIS